MAEVVAPPDVETAYVAYLRAQFVTRSETAKVATKVPTTRPDRMVRVSLTDTIERTDIHFDAELLVECWAPTETAASGLARLAYGLTRALEGEVSGGLHVAAVTAVSGIANFPDPDVGPRYQFVVDLQTRGGVI